MSDLKALQELVIKFRDQRDWKQFHNPKDMAISMSLEASEVLELFQWKSPEEIEKFVKGNKQTVSDEIADVLKYMLIMSHDLNIDLSKAVKSKLFRDGKKYPVKKARGNHKKYNEYE